MAAVISTAHLRTCVTVASYILLLKSGGVNMSLGVLCCAGCRKQETEEMKQTFLYEYYKMLQV